MTDYFMDKRLVLQLFGEMCQMQEYSGVLPQTDKASNAEIMRIFCWCILSKISREVEPIC